jgi:hypothetical protein
MRPTAFAVAAWALALASCATTGREASGEFYYRCEMEQADSSGRVSRQVDLELDGTLRAAHAVWTQTADDRGARLSMRHFGPNPRTTDDLQVTISYPRTWLSSRRLRLELFRSIEGRQAADGLLADPSFYSSIAPQITRWSSQLHRFAAGETYILAGVAEQGGALLARDRIDLAQIALAATAFARAQPQLDAMVSDYRNSCRRIVDQVIVT